MEFSLFPAGELYAGGIFYDGAHAREVLAGFRGWIQGLPPEASASLAFLRLPDLEEVPGFLRGEFVMHLRFAWQGSQEEGSAVLAPMRAAARSWLIRSGCFHWTALMRSTRTRSIPCRCGRAGCS